MTSVPLAADFPAADREQWRSLVAAVLAKSRIEGDPELALATPTYDGFDLRPLYTAEDLPAGFSWAAHVGRAETAIGWDVRQRHTEPDPAAANRAILADLDNGVTSIWLSVGPSALALVELPRALEGVYLDLAPVVLDAGVDGAAAAQALVTLADERGVRAELAGSLGLDPIAVRARTGAGADLGELVEAAQLCRDRPRLAAITVDGTVYHEAGGSDAQELGIAAAVAVAYLLALSAEGWAPAAALRLMECRYAVTADQFASIAKLRAARRIWARIGSLCEAPGVAQRQHAATSRAMLTQRDPWVNLLRTTVACFAAASAGADAITVESFDSAIGQPDDFGRRIARNTQSILHDESSLARVSDPAAGSWYVEARTDALAHAAWDVFTGIERSGGALAALDSGLIPHLLAGTRQRRAEAIACRREAITGVSEFAFLDEAPVTRPTQSAQSARTASDALLPSIRFAADFEGLRDRADAAGARPKVFLAALGPPAAYSGRVGFASNLFQAGGIEPVVGTGDAAALAKAFAASGSVLACLCSSDAVYTEQAAEVTAALTAAGAVEVWVAGQDIRLGGNALDVLGRAFDALGVAS